MRTITLLLENGTTNDLDTILNYCKENNIEFEFEKTQDSINSMVYYEPNLVKTLYYFNIKGHTKDYDSLKELLGDKLITTKFADICNIVDSDDNLFEDNLKTILSNLQNQQNIQLKNNRLLLDFIKPIKDVKILKELKKYECHFSDFQKKILQDRIDICSGNQEKINEEFASFITSMDCDVKKLREKTKMNRKEFCKYFNIPYRTVEDWENKKSTCAIYLFNLMEKDLKNNGLI